MGKGKLRWSIGRKESAHFTDGKTSLSLEISLCESCGFVFQSSAYGDEYDAKVVLAYQNYGMSDNFAFPRRDGKSLDSLRFIIENSALDRHSSVLEIGSDTGDFLYILHENTGANVVGMEPVTMQMPRMPTVRGYFNRHSFCSMFDLIILKHTLEHIKNPRQFMAEVWEALSEEGLLYIEVPSLEVSMRYFLEDFSLEHVSYFTCDSVLRLLGSCEVVAVDDSHFLRLLVRRSKGLGAGGGEGMNLEIKRFFAEFDHRLRGLERRILRHSQQGIVVFYGVGLYFRALLARLLKNDLAGGGEALCLERCCGLSMMGWLERMRGALGLGERMFKR